MKLFSKDEVNRKRKEQTHELIIKNEKLISSLKKVIKLQNDVEFDTEKAKKIKDFEIWIKDTQEKQSKELEILNNYKKAVENKKEEYYNLVDKIDFLQDKKISLEEEIGRLNIQVTWKQELLK